MHRGKRKVMGSGMVGRAIVAGVLERGTASHVKLKVLPNVRRPHITQFVRTHVEPGSEVMTDDLLSYRTLRDQCIHKAVDHSIEYVRDHVHTNGLENFWSLLRRMLGGTYVAVV